MNSKKIGFNMRMLALVVLIIHSGMKELVTKRPSKMFFQNNWKPEMKRYPLPQNREESNTLSGLVHVKHAWDVYREKCGMVRK